MKLTTLLSLLVISALSYAGPITEANVNLFYKRNSDISGKSAKAIHQSNLKLIKDFVAVDVDGMRDNSQGRAKYISPADANSVRRAALMNPVVSLSNYHQYDPTNRGIGFCFGRAMFVNIELAYRQFDRDSIKKAFVVGPMTTGGSTKWAWHVTTIVQSKNKDGSEVWLAIDPITGLKSLKDWYLEMYNDFSTDKKLKLYVTVAGKFGPSPSFYDERAISNAAYNDYFTDMREWFAKQYENDMYVGKEIKEYNP